MARLRTPWVEGAGEEVGEDGEDVEGHRGKREEVEGKSKV